MKLTQKRVRLLMQQRRQKQSGSNPDDDLSVKINNGLERAPLAVGLTVENAVDSGLGDLQPLRERDLTQASSSLDLDEHLGRCLFHGDSFYTRSDTTVNTRMTRKLLPTYTQPYISQMKKTVADRIDQLMALRGVRSQSELARRSGVPQATISRTLKGGSVPELDTVRKLAEALSSTSSWLVDGVGPGPERPDHRPPVQLEAKDSEQDRPLILDSVLSDSLHNERRTAETRTQNVPIDIQYSAEELKYRPIPVIGRAQGGMPERIWTDGDYPVGATDKYAMIATSDPHAFLTPIIGTSMVPKFNPGDFAFVEPGTPAEIEDDVLVRLVTGETMLKRLISRRGGIQLASYNEPGTMLFAPEEIAWMYYVAHYIPARKIKDRV